MGAFIRFMLLAITWIVPLFALGATVLPPGPLSVGQRVASSDAVVMGQVVRSYSKQKQSPAIMEVVLDVERAVGLSFNQIRAKGNFKFQYLGGNTSPRQVPRFSVGERAVVMLRHVQVISRVNYLEVGKFSPVYRKGEDFLLGEGETIAESDFARILAASHFKSVLAKVPGEREIVRSGKSGSNYRAVASVATEQTQQVKQYDSFSDVVDSFLWVAILVALSMILVFIIRFKVVR